MGTACGTMSRTMRSTFEFAGHVNWFPGHMATTARLMRERMAQTQVFLEIRDARVPFSSINPLFEEIMRDKPRVVVLNKADLVGSNLLQAASKELRRRGTSEVVCASA